MCLVYLLGIAKMRNLQDEIVKTNKCLTCNNSQNSPFASIFDHPSLLYSLSEVIGVQVKREKYYPETLCYQCCCFVNRVMEFRRISQIRMQDFREKANNGRIKLNGVEKAAAKLAEIDNQNHQTSTQNTSSQQNGDKIEQTPPKSKLFGQNEHFKNAGFSGPIIASVQTGVSLSPIAMDEEEEEIASTTTNSSHLTNGNSSLLASTVNSGSRLLLPMFECSESVIDTESGGNIDLHNTQQNEKRKQSPTSFYTCPHCNKVYRKLLSLEKHVRRHIRKLAIQERHKRNREEPIEAVNLQCGECEKVFENRHELRLHNKIHRKRYDCEHCDKKFYNFADNEWHRAICDGMRRAQDENEEASSVSSRRRTRSRYGRLSAPPDYEEYDEDEEEDDDDDDNISEFSALSTPSFNAKIQSINRWIQNGKRHSPPPQSEHLGSSIGGDSDLDDRMSMVSGLTNITNLSDFSYCPSIAFGSDRRSYISIRTKYSNKSKSSVGDLMTARSTLSSQTLTRGISRKISKIDLELSFRGNGDNSRDDRMHQRNKKLMRLRNREAKQLMKYGATVFLCSECIFSSESLAVMMQHEKKKHNMLALYKCPECIERFTQEKYLNQHILMHPSGPFYCIHCEEHFDTKFELKIHLDLHLEKSHSCQYCDLSFLKLSQMKQHILTAHLDRLNVGQDNENGGATTKTGIIDRRSFKKQCGPATALSPKGQKVDGREYRVKTLVQSRLSPDKVAKKRRNHYPYLEKLGNIDSKLVQMLRSGNLSGEAFESTESPNTSSTVRNSPLPMAIDPVVYEQETEPQITDYEFQVPDELDTDMSLDEHGIFSLDAIPDPDKTAPNTFPEDVMATLQSPPYSADDTPCSSNGNSPPYSPDSTSPPSSTIASAGKRHYHHRKRSKFRINVNSKRITKQIVQNNLKVNHLRFESSILPSYTLLFRASKSSGSSKSTCSSSSGNRMVKKCRKLVNNSGNGSVSSRHSGKDGGPWRT